MVKCQRCDRIIMDSTSDGGYKLRSRMVLFKDGNAIALCPTCKEYVEVPICLGSAISATPKQKHVVNIKKST